MHTLGFDHEQCRSDRDNYVIVNFDNMKSGKSQFYKTNTLDRTPYDYESIMQYGLEVRMSISTLHQLRSITWFFTIQVRIILHEMMHTMGFRHEQSRSDRDDYVIIHFDNMYGYKYAFYKRNTLDKFPYDYESIMQYGLWVS